MTYEMKIARQEKEMQDEESKNKSIAPKAQEEKVVEETKINDMEEMISPSSQRECKS